MKKITNLFVVVTILISSCTKVLDVEPTASVSSDEAIKNKVGVERAITGAYTSLQAAGLYGRNAIIVGDIAADNLTWTGTTYDYFQFGNHAVAADNGIIDGMWTASYDGLNRVNNVLNVLPEIADITESDRNKAKGEALYMRALFHFNLLLYYGGVPLKTTPTLDISSVDQARNTPSDVFEQVITDLTEAETLLPEALPSGRTSSFAASAMLARVYLTRYHATGNETYAQQAIARADRLISQSSFSLSGDYAAIYQPGNTEVIFEIAFDAQNKNRLAEYFFSRKLAGRYEVAPSQSLIDSYESGDLRKDASIATDSEGKVYCIKYSELSAGSDAVIVSRLAEMYLIKAEALAYTNGDIDDIRALVDAVRTRAGLSGTTASDYASLRQAIENERRHEFAFEGHRWFDLVRTGKAAGLFGIEEKYTVFPIPLIEMQTNKLMVQNDGY